MTGLEIIKATTATAGKPCPPVIPETCDRLSCRECWLAWLVTGEPPKEKGPSDEQTAPDEEGLHPNLIEHFRRERRFTREMLKSLATPYSKA